MATSRRATATTRDNVEDGRPVLTPSPPRRAGAPARGVSSRPSRASSAVEPLNTT